MYGRNAQKLNKRQEFIKVHVLYKREKEIETLKNYGFLHFYLGYASFFSFISTLLIIPMFLLFSSYGLVNPSKTPMFFRVAFFSMIPALLFVEFSVLIDDLNFVFPIDYKFSFIIDPSSLIHEIIHGHIYEKFQGIEKWEVWVIDRWPRCLGYPPKNIRFPIFTIKLMIGELFHLIHDLISSFFDFDVYSFFEYIKDSFTEERNYIKELKTQIKARKT